MRRIGLLLVMTSTSVIAFASQAQDTTSYGYDEHGRLITTAISGGPSNGVSTRTCFDKAGNRTHYAVAAGAASCTPAPTPTPTPTPPPGNGPPVAGTDSYTITCNSGGGFYLFTNDSDPDGDPLTLTSVSSNGGFSISIGNASLGIAGIGASSAAGSYTGSYVVSDGHSHSTTGTINITVTHGGPGGC